MVIAPVRRHSDDELLHTSTSTSCLSTTTRRWALGRTTMTLAGGTKTTRQAGSRLNFDSEFENQLYTIPLPSGRQLSAFPERSRAGCRIAARRSPLEWYPSPRRESPVRGPFPFDYNTARSRSIAWAEVAELADALDSNSSEAHTSCGFDPRLRHSRAPACALEATRTLVESDSEGFLPRNAKFLTSKRAVVSVDFVLRGCYTFRIWTRDSKTRESATPNWSARSSAGCVRTAV